ncbi:prepilin peptidase, partial [Mycobacterium scrofulaceum]
MRLGAVVAVLAWLLLVSGYDLRERRLPNPLTLTGAGVILVAAAGAGRGGGGG